MKIKFLLATIASIGLAGPSQAAVIAGWDFSQYAIPGALSIDGATLQNTLLSNHSELDPTNQSGIESNQYGTLHLDGSFGSYNTPLDFTDAFVPTVVPPNNSLLSNQNQVFLGYGSNAACVQGQIENMPGANCGDVAMTSIANVGVVFEVKPSATNPLLAGEDWSVSFAGLQLAGSGSSASVEFSPDGINYVLFGAAAFTNVDTLYTFALNPGLFPNGYVRLTFNGTSDANVPAIDNLGVSATLTLVPEPGTALLLGAGLIGLVHAGRHRA